MHDNLNGCADDKLKIFAFTSNYETQLRSLFQLMSTHFVAPVYICSASAERWGVRLDFDAVSARCRALAAEYGVIACAGEEFWSSIAPSQVYYPWGGRSPWHHGEPGGEARLARFKGRELINLALFSS